MMEKPKLKAAILVVSDTASHDPSTDTAGEALSTAFASYGGDQWVRPETKIVPDDVLMIQQSITGWSDGEDYFNLVVTTGGTGFAVRDNTPEAVNPLIHRHAPGLVHGMLAASLEVTPFALMSRPVAGIRHKTLVLTLPGSPKGAKENLLAVLELLPHACLQAAGQDSRSIHAGGIKKLEQEAGVSSQEEFHHHNRDHSHSHSHGGHAVPQAHTDPSERPVSNDPRAGPTSRHRESPYPMRSVSEATRLILAHSPAPEAIAVPVNGGLVGYILAQDVQATEAVPAYRASIVDGYAVVVSPDGPTTKGVFPVTSVSHATPGQIPELHRGQIARITTGAPLPPGANAVVMVEDTALRIMTDDGSEEKIVEILTDKTKADENVREVGSDIKAGEVILSKGEEITATGGELGLLASVGKAEVMVYEKPVVGVLSTGDEIVPHDRPGPLQLGAVRDCNRPTIMAAIRGWGFDIVDLGIAKDQPGYLETHLRSSFQKCSIIITTGGVSMGELDLLKPTIERSLGGTIHFGRVSMKPGKPTTFSTVPLKALSSGSGHSYARKDRLIFSLPGNPASALVTAHLFVLPCLQKWIGRPEPWGLPVIKVLLGDEVRCDAKREEYHRVGLRAGEDGRVWAVSTGGQRSSRIGSLRGAGGLLRLPAGGGVIGKGAVGECLVMGDLEGLRKE